MDDLDKESITEYDHWNEDEHEMFHGEVIQGDHLLLYLDTYLRELMQE